jgi:hypothetical protein
MGRAARLQKVKKRVVANIFIRHRVLLKRYSGEEGMVRVAGVVRRLNYYPFFEWVEPLTKREDDESYNTKERSQEERSIRGQILSRKVRPDTAEIRE